MTVTLTEVTARDAGDGVFTWIAARGTITNQHNQTIQFGEIFTPVVQGLDSAGGQVWSLQTGGSHDVAVPAGQPRPSAVVLQAGQTIGWAYPEEKIPTEQYAKIASWFAGYQPGRLMALWVPNSLTGTCGTVDGWR
ncbi:hypothetical protein [Actinotalea sp. JY-7876]|uniref:hypothetical protein n=1 Tax=Actinotalea sp. JY-7876 TaxID=2758442 RepID=UPI0015F6C31F|nr:hypothetical protein [Actinotalea sp. JY-7876]